MEFLGDMMAWTAVDAVAQNANNEITLLNFVGQALALKKHILTSKPGTNPPGTDDYIKLYDLLVEKKIIECKVSGASAITWTKVCTINQENLKNLSQITYPEAITKSFQVNTVELSSFLKNYKYNALDGTQLIGHVKKNENIAQPNAKQLPTLRVPMPIAKQLPLRQRVPMPIAKQMPLRQHAPVKVGGGKTKTRRNRKTRSRRNRNYVSVW